jgi:hypothetical protein
MCDAHNFSVSDAPLWVQKQSPSQAAARHKQTFPAIAPASRSNDPPDYVFTE